MGFYIETGQRRGKAETILEQIPEARQSGDIAEARALSADPNSELAPVFVISNGIFDAAGFAWSEAEFERFVTVRDRPWVLLLVPRKRVEELTRFNPNNYPST